MEDNITNNQIKNIILNYYRWEKEKEKLLIINENNPINNNKHIL